MILLLSTCVFCCVFCETKEEWGEGVEEIFSIHIDESIFEMIENIQVKKIFFLTSYFVQWEEKIRLSFFKEIFFFLQWLFSELKKRITERNEELCRVGTNEYRREYCSGE